MKLNWYRTRRVVKWSRVVRQEKAALHYGITSMPAGLTASVDDENAGDASAKQLNKEISLDTVSKDVAASIRERRAQGRK